MEELHIVIVSLGSMGKRRAKIVRRLYPDFKLIGVDLQEKRRDAFVKEFLLPAYSTVTEAKEKNKIDAAIISTSPLSHGDIANECLGYGWHVFTEINLQPYRYEENMRLARQKNVTLFLSSTPFYREEIKYISDEIKQISKLLAYTYHIGQYLPDWHPWENYRDFFVVKRESNACREIFAIELPWLVAAFGRIKSVKAASTKLTALELPYHDNFMVIVRHEGGNMGMIAIDVVCREAVKNLFVYGEEFFLSWEGKPNGILKKDIAGNRMVEISPYDNKSTRHDDNYSPMVLENPYEAEVQTFVAQIQSGIKAAYGYADDLQILSWIDKIEEVMEL